MPCFNGFSTRALRIAIVCALFAAEVSTARCCRAQNPFSTGEATSSDTVTWRKRGESSWKLDDVEIQAVVGVPGKTGGLLCRDKLLSFAADGTPETSIVPLRQSYAFVGLRPTYIIGVTQGLPKLEILDRKTGLLLRSVDLGQGAALSLQLHPHAPVCYVSHGRRKDLENAPTISGFITTIDETRASVLQTEDNLGQTMAIDPQGRFLVSGFFADIPVGSLYVRIPGGVQPRFRTPTPSMRPVPDFEIRPDRTQVITQFANVKIAIVYDLDDERSPQAKTITGFEEVGRGLRLSFDGRLLTGLGYSNTVEARDPIDGKAEPITFEAAITKEDRLVEFLHHPAIPISVIVRRQSFDFFNTTTGRRDANSGSAPLSAGGFFLDRAVSFSPDGRYVMAVARTVDKENRLLRIPVAMSPENLKLLNERLSVDPEKSADARRVPLARFDALRGGLSTTLRSSDISKRSSNSIVVVKSKEGSGTGFVVGSSGYILTCAHCVSRFTPTVVVYRSAQDDGSIVESEAAATVLQRDAKLDLALLKIDAAKPLAAVVLAQPVDTAHGGDVTVIANPVLGDTILKNTITTGVVSNPSQQLDGHTYIQSSAVVNPGSSGGPMFDQYGRVIGMVVLKAKIEGVGFAVPSRRITEFLLRSASFFGDDGKLLRSWVDDAEKSERKGAFVKADGTKLTILEMGSPVPQSLDIVKLSAGDRAFLEFLTDAVSKKKP